MRRKAKADYITPHAAARHLEDQRKKRIIFLYKGRNHTKTYEERREDYELARIKRDGGVILSIEYINES